MALRKVPGAVALGLLASLAVHAVLYRGEHAMAGGYHADFVAAAAAAALGFLTGFAALAWSGRGQAADGSIVAARLNERLPALWQVGVCAALWLSLAEAIEPSHAAPMPLVTALCIAAVAWAITLAARAIVAALAGAIIAICRDAFSPRTPAVLRRSAPPPLRRDLRYARRRFARPPPIALLHRA